jgi:hypothetical protein
MVFYSEQNPVRNSTARPVKGYRTRILVKLPSFIKEKWLHGSEEEILTIYPLSGWSG